MVVVLMHDLYTFPSYCQEIDMMTVRVLQFIFESERLGP